MNSIEKALFESIEIPCLSLEEMGFKFEEPDILDSVFITDLEYIEIPEVMAELEEFSAELSKLLKFTVAE